MAEGSPNTSIRALIGSVTADAKRLMQDQAELTKMEARGNSKAAGSTGGLFAGAAFIAVFGVLFILITLAFVLVAIGLPEWAGFGIVALLLILIAAILGGAGRAKAKKLSNGLAVSKAEWSKTRDALSGQPESNLPAPRPGSAVGDHPRE